MTRTPANRIFLAAQAGALLVLLLFITDLFFNQHRDLAAGKERAQRFNFMMAEHTARTFDAVDILLREIAGELSRSQTDWRQWKEDDGWSYLAQRHSRAMPQLRALFIYDERGQPRHQSIPGNKQNSNISQQSYFSDLANGKKFSRAGPVLEENTGQYAYTLGHRITDQQGSFSGLALATLEPLYLQDFCWPNRLTEDFEAVLINNEGKIIAACRPSNIGRQSSLLGRMSEEALFSGQLRGLVPDSGTVLRGGFVISMVPVPGFPELHMLTAATESSLLATWYSRMQELSILAILVVSIILAGGYLMRRQLEKVNAMTEELEAGRNELAQRVTVATEQLAKQRDNAELANMAKSRFLAAASHDLRQPMHALSLFATDLQAQARTGTYRELPRLAEQIGRSTQLLSELLDSLLDLSRLDVAGISPDPSTFPLQTIFDRLATSYKRAALDKELFLRFRFTKCWLHSDPAMIERMLSNLLSNAIRYTPRGGRVLIAARRRAKRVVIEVRDSGIGIADINQVAIFSEFYQVANSAREQHQGLGLGLSIVERLARALKVDVGLRSALNRGTLFTLTVQGAQRIAPEKAIARQPRDLATLYFIGDSSHIMTTMKLTESWGYHPLQQPSIDMPLPELPYNTIVLTELQEAAAVRALWPGNLSLIAFVAPDSTTNLPGSLAEGTHLYRLPIRPAKLRALLGQLQNTSSKSIP